MLRIRNREDRAAKPAAGPFNPPDITPETMEELILAALQDGVGFHREVIWARVMSVDGRWANMDNVGRFNAALESLVASGKVKTQSAYYALVRESEPVSVTA